MICPSCHKEIGGNLKFCSNCGTRLQVHYCRQCGSVLSTDKKFCEKCGAPNQFYQPAVTPVSSASNEHNAGNEVDTEKQEGIAKSAKATYVVYSQPVTSHTENNMVVSEQTSQTEERVACPESKEDIATSEAEIKDSNVNGESADETGYETEEIKDGKGKIFLVLFLIVVLGAGGLLLGQRQGWWNVPILSWVGGSDGTASCESYEEVSNFVEGSQGMLKAFGLKGRVKTLTFKCLDYDNSFTFAFDIHGNFREAPDYNGREAVMNARDIPVYCDLTIDNWKWRMMDFSGLNIVESVYEFTSYDEYNRPNEATVNLYDEVSKSNVAITYSGSDSHDNYTTIKFAIDGATTFNSAMTSYLVKTIQVKIEYWPDDASGDDGPTDLTESMAIDIIKKANRKESVALTHEFNKILEMRDAVPVAGFDSPEFGGDGSSYFYEGIGTGTLLADFDNTDIPNIKVRIHDLRIHDTGDIATVAFYFSNIYEGKTEDLYEEDLSDNKDHFVTADMKFEDGKWVVDDIGYDVVYAHGIYVHGNSYRNYYDNLDVHIKDIRSGEREREIRETFSEDPKLEEYLKKLDDFKKRFDIK